MILDADTFELMSVKELVVGYDQCEHLDSFRNGVVEHVPETSIDVFLEAINFLV